MARTCKTCDHAVKYDTRLHGQARRCAAPAQRHKVVSCALITDCKHYEPEPRRLGIHDVINLGTGYIEHNAR